MSYIPLYRKYRPQKFSDLVGQEAIERTLSNAINLGKVSHAYLFTGPRGTGKTSTARIFAKSLNCIQGPTATPCGKCPSCIDITNSSSIDVIEIDAASNRKVEDARNLLEKVQFVPVSGKYKIYIIDEVHMLTTEAFNTLLKTLEEPPKNLVFILATTESHKVLNTIISRCQKFDFRRINQELIFGRLKEIIKLENIKITDKALYIIARRSLGGMRDALSLLDQAGVLSSIQSEVTEQDILTLLGSMPEDILYNLGEAIADRDSYKLLTVLNQVIEAGGEPVQVLRELIGHFRNLLLIGTAKNIDEVKILVDATVSEQLYESLIAQAKKFEVNEIAQIIEKLAEYEKTLRASSQQYLWLEVSLVSVCHRHEIQIIKDLELRLEKLEQAVLSGNIKVMPESKPIPKAVIPEFKPETPKLQQPQAIEPPQAQPSKEKITSSKPADIITEEPNIKEEAASLGNSADWMTVLENIESIPSRMFFSNLAKPVEINAKRVVITFSNESFVKQAQAHGKITPLEKALEKLFATTPVLICRTPLPDDDLGNKISSNTLKPQLSPVVAKLQNKEIIEQISQGFDVMPVKPVPKIHVDETPSEPLDDEIIDQIENIEKSVAPINLSDQAKLVVDLFQGKIIN